MSFTKAKTERTSPGPARSQSVPRLRHQVSKQHVSYCEYNPLTGEQMASEVKNGGQTPLFTASRGKPAVALTRGRAKVASSVFVTSPTLKEFDSGPGTPRSPSEHRGANLSRRPYSHAYDHTLDSSCVAAPDTTPRKAIRGAKKIETNTVDIFSTNEEKIAATKARETHFNPKTRGHPEAPATVEHVHKNSRIIIRPGTQESAQEYQFKKSLQTVDSAPQDNDAVPLGGTLTVDTSVPKPSLKKFEGIKKQARPTPAAKSLTAAHLINSELAAADPVPEAPATPSKNFKSPNKLQDSFDIRAQETASPSTPTAARRGLAITANQHLMETMPDNGVANPLFHSPPTDTRPDRLRNRASPNNSLSNSEGNPINHQTSPFNPNTARPETAPPKMERAGSMRTSSSKSYNILEHSVDDTPRTPARTPRASFSLASGQGIENGTATPARTPRQSFSLASGQTISNGSPDNAAAAAAAAARATASVSVRKGRSPVPPAALSETAANVRKGRSETPAAWSRSEAPSPRFASRPRATTTAADFGWGGAFE